MHELQLTQERTDKFVIGINPQLIEPMFGLLRHILMKQSHRAKCQRQKRCTFYKFEKCDHEQSSVAMYVRSSFRRHYISYRAFALTRTESDCVSLRRDTEFGLVTLGAHLARCG